MLKFGVSTHDDYVDFGRQIWLEKDGYTSHEQASQSVARSLFEEFVTEDGEPQLAMVRIFRLTYVSDLPADLQRKVGTDEREVMALTGTWGIEEAWQKRTRSVGHQAIPISQMALPNRIPMFQEVLTQLGIDIDHFYETGELNVTRNKPYQGTIYIPDAASSVISAQKDFVQPYGIKSLVGFGGFMGASQAMYVLYAFSRVRVSSEAAQAFFRMQEFVGATIALDEKIFDH